MNKRSVRLARFSAPTLCPSNFPMHERTDAERRRRSIRSAPARRRRDTLRGRRSAAALVDERTHLRALTGDLLDPEILLLLPCARARPRDLDSRVFADPGWVRQNGQWRIQWKDLTEIRQVPARFHDCRSFCSSRRLQ